MASAKTAQAEARWLATGPLCFRNDVSGKALAAGITGQAVAPCLSMATAISTGEPTFLIALRNYP